VSATLRLTRKHPLTELRRGPFEIKLDGQSVGSIDKTNETSEVPVEAGHHTLRIESGRSTSPARSFDAADGEVINFRTHGPLVWPVYVASIFKPDLGISLKRE
jgi:hypothetical protein